MVIVRQCCGGQDMALPPRDQRHQYLRYEGLQYTDADILDFESRLTRIYRREVHRVHVFDFGGLPDLMAEGLSARMLMEHRDAQGQSVFTSRAWRRLFDIRGPLVHELILEFFSTFRISYARDFLGTTPSYTAIRDPILRLCHRLISCSVAGRSQAPEKVTVTDLFYLRRIDVSSVNVPYLLARSMLTFFDIWAWVALGPERQPDAAVGALRVAQDAPAVDKGRLGRLEEEVLGLRRDAGSLRRLVVFDGTFRWSSPAAFQRRTRQRTGEASTSTA
ncbi:hypothetical protein Tco_1087296 [Tanacetum coccineum]